MAKCKETLSVKLKNVKKELEKDEKSIFIDAAPCDLGSSKPVCSGDDRRGVGA
jgi:hypothetical protein